MASVRDPLMKPQLSFKTNAPGLVGAKKSLFIMRHAQSEYNAHSRALYNIFFFYVVQVLLDLSLTCMSFVSIAGQLF
jgi:hypothetical protein